MSTNLIWDLKNKIYVALDVYWGFELSDRQIWKFGSDMVLKWHDLMSIYKVSLLDIVNIFFFPFLPVNSSIKAILLMSEGDKLFFFSLT
jgi:hypothetical protein